MKIHPVGAAPIHAARQRDGQAYCN